MVDFADFKLAITPAKNRTGAVTILIHQANVLNDVKIVVLGFKNHLMLIDLANLTFNGDAGNNIFATEQLVATEIGIHTTLSTILRLELKKLKDSSGHQLSR
jgi:hypothetical protein